jgi:hypothetical protein
MNYRVVPPTLFNAKALFINVNTIKKAADSY